MSIGERLRALTEKLKDGPAPRYLLVVVAGFLLDLSIAWATRTLLAIDLVIAAAIGFVVAMTLSYFAHELWTFHRAASAVSLRRFMKFVAACAAIFVTRLILVWATGLIAELPGGDLARLLIAYGGSLVVGFFLNRTAVFDDEPAGGKVRTP
jgi:putative flippase GtrA